MFPLDMRSSKPIYEQIIDNIKEQTVKGILKPQDKLPSVRQLAGMLTVNPNTVSKAYAELERQKVIETIRGRGTFVCELSQVQVDDEKLEQSRGKLKDLCIEMSYLGLDKQGILQEVETIFKGLQKEV
jgi:GntR family transcriptional regulator